MEEGPETPVRARARDIVRAVLDLHGDALKRMMGEVAAGHASPQALVDAFAHDPQIAGVLLLHGLHPLDLESRVRAALAALAPSLQKQFARLAAVTITDGTVRVRLERGAGHGGPAAAPLRAHVEDAIVAAAPDAVTIEVEVPPESLAFVPVEHVRLRGAAREVRPG
jgi:hypothetical protein